MEFSLMTNETLTMINDGTASSNKYASYNPVAVKLKPLNIPEERIGVKWTENLCSVLAMNLTKSSNPVVVQLTMRIVAAKAGSNRTSGSLQPGSDRIQLWLLTTGDGTFLERVFTAFKKIGSVNCCNASIRVSVRYACAQSELGFESVCKIRKTSNKITGRPMYSADFSSIVTEEITRCWTTGNKKLTGVYSFTLVLNNAAVNMMMVHKSASSTLSKFLMDLLQDEAEADAKIIPGGRGANPIYCHRAILATRSPVFKAMLQSGMKEAETSTIKILTNSETELKALIKYLYTRDVEAPLAHPDISLEMLKAGNFYDVPDLRVSMHELMMIKPNEWFGAEVAVDLLVFTRNMMCSTSVVGTLRNKRVKLDVVGDGTLWKDLNLKAMEVLVWYSKEKHLELLASKKYKKLFKESTELAMEIHVNLLKFVDIKALNKGF